MPISSYEYCTACEEHVAKTGPHVRDTEQVFDPPYTGELLQEDMEIARRIRTEEWLIEQARGMQNMYAPRAKTAEPNPKDLLGVKKPPNLSVIPSAALIHMGRAMQNGADKYGPFNWREHPVRSSIYVDACIRHIMAWQDGEEDASDSGVHHLGHAMACMGILVDAQEVGNLIDERVEGPVGWMIDRFTQE